MHTTSAFSVSVRPGLSAPSARCSASLASPTVFLRQRQSWGNGAVGSRGTAGSLIPLHVGGGPEALAEMGPRANAPEAIVFISIMTVFFALRQRTEAAITARDRRMATEEQLQAAKAARVEGEEGAAQKVNQLAAQLKVFSSEEEELMQIPYTSFRLRLPPPPRDADDIARERVARSRQVKDAPVETEEDRLPRWAETLIVVGITLVLSPFLFIAFIDPTKPPSADLQLEIQRDTNAPPPGALRNIE